MIVFDLDDLCDDLDPWSELCSLKERFPKLKVTLFAIPGRCSSDLMDRYAALDWVELGVHGYHHSSMECAIWGYQETTEKLAEVAEKLPVSRLFKAPGWVGNPEVARALKDSGWALAHHAGHDEWGDDLPPAYVYNDDTFMVTAIHGHTWDSCGNGPSAWGSMFADVDADADFAFVSEVVRGWSRPSTYLWKVIDQMGLEDGDLFVDCGAFDGAEIEVLHPKGINVLSFEPHPRRFADLRRRWDGVDGVEVVGAAVGSSNGKATLYESTVWDSGSTLEESKVGLKPGGYEVDVVRLADMLRDREVKVLKLDIEGTEWEVLDDLIAEGILQKCRQVYLEDHIDRINDPEIAKKRDSVLEKCSALGIELREWV